MFEHQGNPKVELLLPEGDKWMLLEDWWFTWVGEDGRHIRRTIKAGMVTDFGSIPRLARWLYSPTGRYAPGYLAHDELYAQGTEPRAVCDRVLKMAVESCRPNDEWKRVIQNWIDRTLIHRVVRWCGWVPYGKHREERNRKAKA